MRRNDGARRLTAAYALLLVLWGMLPTAATAQVDETPPVIHVTHNGATLADGALFRGAVTPVVEVTDESTITVEALLDGATFTSGTAVSGEGTHALLVTATDAADNEAQLAVSFTIDTTPPSFASVQPPRDSLLSASQVTLTGSVVDAVSLTVDGQSVPLAGNSFSAGPYTLAEGQRSWTLTALDAAGNSAAWEHRLVRDATPPAVSIGQPAAGALLGAASVAVSGTVADPHLDVVTVNGTASTLSGSTFQSASVPLSEGTNQLSVEARDRAGNAAQASRTVEVDTQAPTIAVSDPAPGTLVPGDAITVSGSVVEPHLDRVEVNGFRATVTGATWSVRVPLVEGVNTLLARATDRLGKSASSSVAIIRDSSAPAIHIEQPDDGSYLTAATVHVTGTVETESGLTVTVNGAAATVADGHFAADVPLVEGENRLIARVTDSLGNQGAHTRVVYRDNEAPTLVTSEPASGALAVDPEASFRLTFSEPLAPVTAGWSLATAAGAQLAAVATLDGATLTLRPSAPLPAQTELRLVLTAAIKDRAGNALADPPTLTFTTADTTAPAAPVLDAIAQARLCASRILLGGSAEAGTRIGVTGGAATVQTGAAADGRFSVEVPLLPDALNRLEVTATDLRGNRSPATVAEVVQDCRAPSVLGATFDANAFTIRFSEPMDATTVAAAISAEGSAGALAGSASLSADGATARYELAAPPPAGALRLQVSQAVRDRAGNALVYPYTRLFRTDTAESFVAGRVIDQHRGRPLQGALVLVAASDGVPTAAPQPQQTTAADGRFQLPVAEGTHLLLITRPGYTPSLRLVATSAGRGTDVFDPRLTPAAAFVAVASGGGVVNAPDGLRLDVPSGALAAGGDVSLTGIEEQGLPALLPFGWSPQGAAWVALRTGSFASPATLTLPVAAPNGTELTLAKLDLATLQWKALGTDTVAGGVVQIAATDGAYAALLADEGATAPPAPVVGSSLGSAPAPTGAEVTAAAMTFAPAVVLPAQRSVATVSYTTSGDVASGLPLTLTVREELTLLDQTVRREAPYEADLVLYRSSEGAARSRFGLVPSTAAQTTPISMGAEDVTVAHYVGGTLQGNVLGAAGGVVGTAEGDRIEVPAGALAEPTAVTLDRQASSSLPQPVPAGTELIGVLAVDLGGRELALPAGLGFELGAAPPSGASGLLLELVEVGGSDLYRAVAALVPTATGWATAPIDAADLPWPGVRRGGRFALVRLLAPVGFLRGHVFAAAGAPRPGAVVRGSAASWVAIADADGRYVLPSPLAAVTVTAEDHATGETAAASATVAQAGQRIDLDLQLARSGPEVVATTPADGAVDVIPGIQPTVRFSKPVDTASLAGGIRLLEDGEDEVAIQFSRQGDLVTVSPRATLRPGTTFELRIGTGVRDLSGTPLETPVVVTFTTRAPVTNAGINLSRIHLVEPTAAGQARIIGRAGAVPHDAAVFAENTSRLASTVTVEAAADGSFELNVEAGLGDTVLLHVLLTGANEVVVELGPFMTADLRSAFVDEHEARFTTGDGIAVVVPAGAFESDAVVTLTPRAPAEITVPLPSTFTAVYGFALSFGGVTANKALQIAVPAPAGSAASGRYLLSRVVDVLGERRWMMHDLMRLDGASITTAEAPQTGAPASALPVKALSSDATSRAVANDAAVRPKLYVPGAGVPGDYQVHYTSTGLYFMWMPVVAELEAAIEISPLGMVVVINREIERLLSHFAVLIPALLGQPATVTVRDLTTGYRLFEDTFDPLAEGQIRQLPADTFGDHAPPYPTTGSPLRFFMLTARPELELSLGDDLVAEASASTLSVRGEAGAAQANVEVRLLGLDDTAQSSSTSATNGSFYVSVPAVAGRRYLLAISAEVAVQEPLEIGFNEGLDRTFPGFAVTDVGGNASSPHPIVVEPVGSSERVRVRPERGWVAGKTYELLLTRELRDAKGNKWERELRLPFKVAKSEILSGLKLERVRDVARLGSLLFVAAETQGLVVVDASNPGSLKSYLPVGATPQDIGFIFPLADPVRGVAVDPHGRVLVAGGGVNNFGQLKIFDALRLTSTQPAMQQAANVFRGSTIISDQLGAAGGTQLPEGTPRRLAVLSQDRKSHWTVGQATLPDGLQVEPTSAPPAGGLYDLTVSGGGATPGAPVTLRNLDRGTFARGDASEGGTFTVVLKVEAGDRLELLRNDKTYAYVTVTGAGIAIVDVNAFYDEDPDHTAGSAVLGYYTGYGDRLELCDQPVSDVSTAMLDLAALWDAGKTGHELSVLGLVGFRGLLMLSSRTFDPSALAKASEGCAFFAGTNNVISLEVLQGMSLLGRPADQPSDWALVTHRQAGLLIYDVSDRTNLVLAARIPLPEQPSYVAVERSSRRAYVSTFSGKLFVVDLASVASRELVDKNGDLRDDRVLEDVQLQGITNSPVMLVPELGIAFTGGRESSPPEESGTTALAIGGPRLAAVARSRDAGGVWRRRQVARLAPFGVPTAADGPAANAPKLAGAFQVYAGLPGWLGPEIRLDVESVGPGGVRIAAAGDSEQLEGLPPVALTSEEDEIGEGGEEDDLGEEEGLLLKRQAADPRQDGYNLYISEQVAVVADLRAARDYERSTKENEAALCPRCDQSVEGVSDEARELLSGESIRVSLPEELRRRLLGTAPGATQTQNYTAAQLEGATLELQSVRWELSPAVRQEPALNPSYGTGDVVPGTLLHSGEMTLAATDLFVKGRGLDFAFRRTYRSQTVGAGPLGPGWELGYGTRLREVPNGDIEYFDGRGRRETFRKRSGAGAATGGYDAPTGRFVELVRTSAGWVLLGPYGDKTRFDRFGRLSSIVDAVKDSAETGNEIRFAYDAASHLVDVEDSLERHYGLAYDAAGRLESIEDFDGRKLEYAYDPKGRLKTVTLPPIRKGTSQFPNGLVTSYEYEVASGELAAQLNRRDNLSKVRDAKQQEWLLLGYDDADTDGRADEVTRQTWGNRQLTIELTFGEAGTTTMVTDRRGHPATYEHFAGGQVKTIRDQVSAQWAFESDAEGLITSVQEPRGRLTTFVYETVGSRRSRGNLRRMELTADSRGANGSSSTLTTAIDYDARNNLPSRIVDPRGTVTEIRRQPSGLPMLQTVGVGAPEEASTTYTYNDYGQLDTVTNGNQHRRRFEYFPDGPRKGYLQKLTVDEGGLDLVTTLETDPRGNVIATVDPRGVRDEADYNELDWVVETREAVSGGGKSLGYTTQLLYDANGNSSEVREPYGESASPALAIRLEYGVLDEVRRVSREIEPGGATAVTAYGYDENLNLVTVTDPEQHETRFEYDERDLPVKSTRGLGPEAASPPVVAQTIYDADRQPERLIQGDGGGRTWLIVRDGFGRVIEQSDPLGNKTKVSYDAALNTTTQRFDAADGLLAESQVVLDALGRPKTRVAKLWEPGTAGAPRELTTTIGYDRVGNVISVTDPLGRVTTSDYDAAERFYKQVDAAGNELELILDRGGNASTETRREQTADGAVVVQSTHDYDALGRPWWSRDALGNETRFRHDARGNLLEVHEPGIATPTVSTYDGLDRLTGVTRPGGVAVFYGYDKASRLRTFRDALQHETSYEYDAADRPTRTHYPDGTSFEVTQYDAASNATGLRDPRGTQITQVFDAANRLYSRAITPGAGVEGVLSESYVHDGLGRLTGLQSGSIHTAFLYDSLSRLVEETTAGKTVRYQRDDAGNPVQLTYPSQLMVGNQFDALDRVWDVHAGGTGLATYGYRGASRVAAKTLGGGLEGSFEFDAVGRPVGGAYRNELGLVMGEEVSWSPRSLKVAHARRDLHGKGWVVGTDEAGRLLETAWAFAPLSLAPNNTQPSPSSVAGLPDGFSYTADTAENLTLMRRREEGAVLSASSLPPDVRNRPASIDGEPLSWDAAGNLKQKGDLSFFYDYRNRLVRVTRGGTQIASYDYDGLGRRVFRNVEAIQHQTAWSGWRPVEEYAVDALRARRTYGRGLDEVVRAELDTDGDGALDGAFQPIYDASGNVAVLTGAGGRILERYEYTPYGPQNVLVDALAPQLEQTRVRAQTLELSFSEGVTEEALRRAIHNSHIRVTVDGVAAPLPAGILGPPLPGPLGGSLLNAPATAAAPSPAGGASARTSLPSLAAKSGESRSISSVSQPVGEGRRARKRLELRFDEPPPVGAAVVVTLERDALEDTFQNRPAAPVVSSFSWPAGDAVIADSTAPKVEKVVVAEGRVEIELSEEPDLATAPAAIAIPGQTLTWQSCRDRYGLCSVEQLSAGTHELTIGAGLTDVGGNAVAVPTGGLVVDLDLAQAPDRLAYERPDPRLVNPVGRQFAWHGLPTDDETGLIYARHRYFDPELGRFISADPLGYVDGPSMYAFGGNNPIDFTDPMGLEGIESVSSYDGAAPCPPSWYASQGAVFMPCPEEVHESSVTTDGFFPTGSLVEDYDELKWSGMSRDEVAVMLAYLHPETPSEMLLAVMKGAMLAKPGVDLAWAYTETFISLAGWPTLAGRAGPLTRLKLPRVPRAIPPKIPAPLVGAETESIIAPGAVWDVGEYRTLTEIADSGLDAHHVGQKAVMKKLVPGYDEATGPSILVPKLGHTTRGPRGILKRTGIFTDARKLLARDIKELRRVYPEVPTGQLQKLIKMNKEKYPVLKVKKTPAAKSP